VQQRTKPGPESQIAPASNHEPVQSRRFELRFVSRNSRLRLFNITGHYYLGRPAPPNEAQVVVVVIAFCRNTGLVAEKAERISLTLATILHPHFISHINHLQLDLNT